MENSTTYFLERSYLYPIVRLEGVLSSRLRHKLYTITVGFLLFFLFVVGAILFVNQFNLLDQKTEFLLFDIFLFRMIGLVLLSFVFWVVVYCLEAFFSSYYFKETEDATITGRNHIPEDMYSFHVLRILLSVDHGRDTTSAFLRSAVGREIIHRTGLYDDTVEAFLSAREPKLYSFPKVSMDRVLALPELAEFIFEADQGFADFLFSKGAQKEEFIGATKWVARRHEVEKQKRRWWSAANLEKIEGIGADWSYGQAYTLKHYADELSGYESGSVLNALSAKGAGYLRQLKNLLSRAREANVLLIGEPGEGMMDIIYAFARDVHAGAVPHGLERKKPMLFDGSFLVSQSRDKNELEMQLVKIMNDAAVAGNIILVFKDFPSFVLSAHQMGSDVVRLMDPYLASMSMQTIALSDKENYHQYLEQDASVKQRFEHVFIERPEDSEMVDVLQQVAEELEAQSGVLFSYSAVREVIKSVYDHFSDPVMPDKAIDILIELPSLVIRKNKGLVEKQDVYEIVEQKTGVPLGKIEGAERETLLHIEEGLHQRVIGQEEAIKVVSNAMRRSRAGVRDTRRPIGSFLFIGPTGVGKTETAKALAQLFFGDEKNMTRLDMSEYNGPDAMSRLIGSFDGGKIGMLVKVLSEHPYGVVLLDEFEKGAREVHDLFLQILDEGFFSDVKGKRVGARDVIFIATSNAGSDLIFKRMQEEENPDMKAIQQEVIQYIIEHQIFKPEFLNRFDGVVLFHPLNLTHIQKVAVIMLEKLKKRLRGRGLDLELTEELVDHIAQQGLDPIFGARPMNRYIQEHIEQIVADKLIRGDIREGMRFTLAVSDLT